MTSSSFGRYVRKPESLGIIFAMFSVVMGVMLPAGALAQRPGVNADKYPLPTKVDGIELGSARIPTIPRASPSRFTLILNGNAVLDKKTGLVWERSPHTEARNWSSALSHCATKNVGGRKGWRVASSSELPNLLDPDNPDGNPDLPVGHPFRNVQGDVVLNDRDTPSFYWLANPKDNGPGGAWDMFVNDGIVDTISEENDFFVWCVIGDTNNRASSMRRR